MKSRRDTNQVIQTGRLRSRSSATLTTEASVDRSVTEDATLDAFASSDESDRESAAMDAESAAMDAESADDSTADPSDVEPARSTYEWTPDGGECADCGTAVDRRWRADGQKEGGLVCADCKDW